MKQLGLTELTISLYPVKQQIKRERRWRRIWWRWRRTLHTKHKQAKTTCTYHTHAKCRTLGTTTCASQLIIIFIRRFFFTSRYLCPNRNRALALCSAHTQKYAHAFSQRGVGGHNEILRTYVEIYVGCTKDDVTQSIEKGDLKSWIVGSPCSFTPGNNKQSCWCSGYQQFSSIVEKLTRLG